MLNWICSLQIDIGIVIIVAGALMMLLSIGIVGIGTIISDTITARNQEWQENLKILKISTKNGKTPHMLTGHQLCTKIKTIT